AVLKTTSPIVRPEAPTETPWKTVPSCSANRARSITTGLFGEGCLAIAGDAFDGDAFERGAYTQSGRSPVRPLPPRIVSMGTRCILIERGPGMTPRCWGMLVVRRRRGSAPAVAETEHVPHRVQPRWPAGQPRR